MNRLIPVAFNPSIRDPIPGAELACWPHGLGLVSGINPLILLSLTFFQIMNILVSKPGKPGDEGTDAAGAHFVSVTRVVPVKNHFQ